MRINAFKSWLSTRKKDSYASEIGKDLVQEIFSRLRTDSLDVVNIGRLDDSWQSESLAFNAKPIMKVENSPFEIAYDVITWTSITGACKGFFFRFKGKNYIAMGSKLKKEYSNKEWNKMINMFDTVDFKILFECNG